MRGDAREGAAEAGGDAADARQGEVEVSAEEFDRLFDEGEDVSRYLDLESARRPGEETRRVNVDFPSWMVDALDRQARHLGVSRQAVIKVWISERLEAFDRATTGP